MKNQKIKYYQLKKGMGGHYIYAESLIYPSNYAACGFDRGVGTTIQDEVDGWPDKWEERTEVEFYNQFRSLTKSLKSWEGSCVLS